MLGDHFAYEALAAQPNAHRLTNARIVNPRHGCLAERIEMAEITTAMSDHMTDRLTTY
jgi:hypothetical protein